MSAPPTAPESPPPRRPSRGTAALQSAAAGGARLGARITGTDWPALWLMFTLLALSALATWQRTPGWPMLVLAGVSTMATAALASTMRVPRGWAIGAAVALAVGVAIGAVEMARIGTIRRDFARFSESDRSARATRVADRIDALKSVLMSAAVAASEQAERGRDSLRLEAPGSGRIESGVVVFDGNRLIAHAGQTRVPLTPGPPGLSLVRTPFYSAMLARATSNDKRFQAVAVMLLSSAPPADRFTQSLVQDVVGVRDASDIDILPPIESSVADPTERRVNYGAAAFARVIVRAELFGAVDEGAKQRARVRTAIPMMVAALLLLIVGWRRPARTRERLLVVFALLTVTAIVPLGDYSNVSALFDPSNFYVGLGWRLTGNIAALLITASLSLCGLFLVLRSRKFFYSRPVAVLIVVGMAILGPFAMRDLARGISPPATGASMKLWMAWQLAIALSGASVLLLGATAGQHAMGARRGLPFWPGPFIASGAAMLAPVLWQAPGTWPEWYPALWIVAIVLLAFVRRGLALVIGVAIVAGCGAVTLTWASTVRTRMRLAENDVASLAVVNPVAAHFLVTFAQGLRDDTAAVREPDALLRRYAASDLAVAGYGARISRWIPSKPNVPVVDVPLVAIDDSANAQSNLALLARKSGVVEVHSVQNGPVLLLIAAVPYADGGVTTVTIPPRTGLVSTDPFAALTGLSGSAAAQPPYSLSLDAPTDRTDLTIASQTSDEHLVWRRRDSSMHGDGYAGRKYPAHVEVELRRADALVPRGALLVLLDAAIVALLWGATAMADGALVRLLRRQSRIWSRSYRVRLSVALLTFFVVPATAFATWAAYRTREDDRAARELAVREALRVAAVAPTRGALGQASVDVGAPLYLYRDGQLAVASDTLLELLAPIGRLLPGALPDMSDTPADDDDFAALAVPAGEQSALVGYRRVRLDQGRVADSTRVLPINAIVATPARRDDFSLDERRADLVVQVLFATALGALAALWLSGVAARSLERPVGALREAALMLASGERQVHLTPTPVTEFAPVFNAFTRMADDLSASRSALEAAQRRTEAVLQHVASGVLAVRDDATIIIANPRAEAMLGMPVRAGSAFSVPATATATILHERVMQFLASTNDDDAFDATIGGRQLSARLTRLPNGAVLTIDDVTNIASAERVLAWGEMARQVAHEIKNPLTPIRLGVQHLRRAYRDKRGDFSDILESNVGRVLEAIDHLDEIARSFSQYGTVPAEREPPAVVALGDVVRSVLALESLGDSPVTWTIASGVGDDRAWARVDELKEVLLNVLENARLAQATAVDVHFDRSADEICIAVTDNGSGIADDVLPRIFEPHFSTRTSGSGLGLAISRRLIESWGGRIAVESAVGQGTTVRITLRAAGVSEG